MFGGGNSAIRGNSAEQLALSSYVVSQQCPSKRVAQLSSARMNEVCAALRFPLGCDSNYLPGTFVCLQFASYGK